MLVLIYKNNLDHLLIHYILYNRCKITKKRRNRQSLYVGILNFFIYQNLGIAHLFYS